MAPKAKDLRKGSNEVLRRVSREFAQMMDEIKVMSVKVGVDDLKSVKADWRITLAMIRHPKFIMIKEDIINAKLK